MIKYFLLPVLLGISLLSQPCLADDDHERARDLVQSGEILPLDDIIKNAFEGKHWKLLEAELEKEKSLYIYELEILDDQGEVRKLKFNAKTGAAITREKE
jgi:uncharacterized membrane protein YkoI